MPPSYTLSYLRVSQQTRLLAKAPKYPHHPFQPHLRNISLSLRRSDQPFPRPRKTISPRHLTSLPPPSRPFATSSRPQSPSTIPTPTPLSPETYHHLSDSYIDTLLSHLETLSDNNGDIEVEYSAGVLTLTYPPNGTYVFNKQPPNRQIWISSPVSGPKRYDWVAREHGWGEWVYLRDGSTLSGLLEEEVGVRVPDEESEGF